MGLIKVLPESIANRIAAGEVVERPASVVKELIENSLDAGATSVEVAVRHGGKSLIRVSDNGCGMRPDDAELAFERHSTSKILAPDDLARIGTYGFRGEALPSIAAVSRTKMITRAEGASSGVEVTVEGGKLTSAKEAACAKGTTVEVRDLYFNTPARRKFLKADATEMGHVMDAVTNFALSRLDIRFVLKSFDKTLFDLPPVTRVLDRVAPIFGEDTAKYWVEVEDEGKGLRIWGVIGKPYIARATRSGQSFFVNRRWIKAFPFSYALQAGYHGLLMQGQFPVAVLYIDVDLERVDVNVHPTKQEVRISNEGQIKSLIKRVVAEGLSKDKDRAPEWRTSTETTSPVTGEGTIVSSITPLGAKQSEMLGVSEPPVEYHPRAPGTISEAIQVADKLKITRILGQVHNTFIIAETEEGLIIIDQHAAHERVMFEALMRNFESGNPAKQGLLMDEVLELAPKYREIFEESRSMLGGIGFDIEEFGENAFVIRSVPAILGDVQPVPLLERFLEEREEGKVRTDLENRTEEVAALIACKRKSVKAFEPLTPDAIRSLLEQLGRCGNPLNCPHGRPTMVKYSFLDIEKQFKRK